jgi:imidazolonepropionase
MRLLTGIGRLYTASAEGVLEDAAVLIDEGVIAWIGPADPGPPGDLTRRIDRVDVCGGGLVTPGLIDAHTHPLYAGDRAEEIAMRSTGATYAEVAAAGGGIGSTVAATRSASPHDLGRALEERLRRWLWGGTTTVETKTGYALDREGELSAVKLLAGLDGRADLPHLEPTFLAAHAAPPEMDDLGRYTREAATWVEDAARSGARWCDVFCDDGYFSVEQSRSILEAGRKAGLGLRVHADELAHTGGARLAAEVEAASADHLLCADADDARALAAAGVVATLAPATALAMGRMPPTDAFLEVGTEMALGTDHNPGTSGTTSMSLVVALAVAAFGISVNRALLAATRGSARSLRLEDRGVVATGRRADLVRWDADHEGAFAWAYGLIPLAVYRDGEPVTAD